MRIELQVVSPESKLVGIDAAMAKLEAMEGTLNRLSQFKKLSFSVSVSAPGLNKIRTDLAGLEVNTKNLAESLRQAGQVGLGNLVEKEVISAGEAMKFAKVEAANLARQMDIAEQKAGLAAKKFGELHGRAIVSPEQLTKMEQLNAFMEKNMAERQAMQKKMGALQGAAGMASAMTGGEKISATAEAEARLEAAQPGAISGMKQQAKIAALKARQMEGLRKQVDAVEKSEKKLDAAMTASTASLSQANTGAKTLSQTWKTAKGGPEELVATRARGATGETITTDVKKGNVTREVSEIEKLKVAVASAEREGSEAMQRATTDWEKLIAVENKARGIRAALAKTSLQDEPFVKQKLAQAAALEMKSQEMAASQAMQAQRAGEIRQMDDYRRSANIIKETAAENRGLGIGGSKSDSYRAEAQALTDLRNSMKLGTLESDAFSRQLSMQATMLRAQANGIDRISHERATMARDRIKEFETLQQRWGVGTASTKTTATATGRRDTTSIDREANGMRETARLTADFDHHGQALNATLTTTASKIEAVEKTTRGYGRSLLNSIGSFAGFVAASSAVYGSLALIGHGFKSFEEMERQSAVLRTVFDGTAQEADDLRDKVLGLAAAYGRGSGEAIDAATRWARIGLSSAQTAELVAVSLEAANVAEISAAVAAEQLAAVYAAFGLTVGQVRVALNEMNTVSNTVNVTVKDLMGGMQRVSGLAKQAGLSMAETIGIIGSAVSRTGRSGGEIGNSMKAMISAVSNPKLQEFLKGGFGIDVKTDGGDIKNFSQVLNELFLTYQKLTDAERQELLVKVGGKQQASRFAAILDGYVKSQKLAIEAQLQMNSSDVENANIRQTMISQLATMGTMFEKLSLDMANAGGAFSLNGVLTEFIKLLGHGLGALDKFPAVTAAMAGLLLILTGRLLMSAMAMQDGAVKGNYLTSTLKGLSDAYVAMGSAVDQANARLIVQDGLLGKIAARSLGVSGNFADMRSPISSGAMSRGEAEKELMTPVSKGGTIGKTVSFIAGAIPTIMSFVKGFVLMVAVMWVINKVFEHFEQDAERARQKLAGFNAELEKTRNISRAADMRQRLAGTLQTSIGSINQRSPQAAREAISNLADVAQPGNPAAATALKEELQGLLERNQMSELEGRLGQIRLGIQKEFEIAKLREIALGKKVQDDLRTQLAAEKQRLATLTGKDREAAVKRIAEAESKVSEEMGRQAQAQQDLVESENQQAEETDKSKAMKKSIASRLETTNKIAEAMPNLDTNLAHWEREQSANAINIAQTKERIRLLKEQQAVEQKVSEKAVDAIKKKVKPLEDIAVTRREGMDKAAIPFETQTWFSAQTNDWKGKNRRTLAERRNGMDLVRQAEDEAVMRNMPEDKKAKYVNYRQYEERGRDEARRTAKGEKFLGDDGRPLSAEKLTHWADQWRDMARALGPQGASKTATAEYEKQKGLLDIAEQQAAAAAMQSDDQIKLEQTTERELATKKAILDQEKERAQILDQIKEGADEAKGLGLRNQIGRNEGEKLVNEFQALKPFENSGPTIQQQETLAGTSANPFKDQAQAMGQVHRMEELLNSAVERRNRLVAETINLKRQEAEEASKNLQMASREEQLRAAGLARFNQQRGRGLTGSEFQFLDKDTKDAVTKFTPDAAPKELRPPSEKAAEEARLLDANIAGMKQVMERTKQVLETLVPAQAKNAPPEASRPEAPQANPTVNITMGDQFNGLVDKITQVVQNDLRRVESKVDAFLGAHAVANAQSAGQLVG